MDKIEWKHLADQPTETQELVKLMTTLGGSTELFWRIHQLFVVQNKIIDWIKERENE